MNKKGFTLVEILAVIVVLSLVITITATKGFGAFDNTKKAITEQNKKAIEEGAKVLLTEIENCDDDLEDYKELCEVFSIKSDCSSCDYLKSNISKKTISISTLKEKKYIEGNDLNNIDGTISITFNKNNNTGSIKEVNIYDNDNATYTPKVYTFTSNNQRKANTTASTVVTFTTTTDGKINFDYFVSSESANYDYLTITLQKDSGIAETILDKTGGENKSGSISKDLVSGSTYKLTFNYRKDVSVDKYEDSAKISNLKITSRLKNDLSIDNSKYYFEKQEN